MKLAIIAFAGIFWLIAALGCAGSGPGLYQQSVPMEEAFRQKALAYEEQGELPQALLAWRVAALLDPENPLASQNIDALEKDIENAARDHFKKGLDYYRNSDLSNARKEFLITLRHLPGHSEARHYLKNRLHRTGQNTYKVKRGDSFTKIAIDAYQDPGKAAVIAYFNDLDPQKPLLIGTILNLPDLPPQCLLPRKVNGRDKAIQQALKQVQIQAIDEKLQSARELIHGGHYAAAIKIMDEALAQAPDNQDVRELSNGARYAVAKELLETGKEAQAIDTLQTMDQTYRDAAVLFSQARAKLAARAETFYRNGVKHFLNEELELAVEAWKQTLTLNPNHPKAKTDMENATRLLKKWRDLDADQRDIISN